MSKLTYKENPSVDDLVEYFGDRIAYVRKLTPKECFRLMDVSDDNIQAIQQRGICKTAQYRMAGNSIVVSCLYHIFKSLFIEQPQPTTRQLSLF